MSSRAPEITAVTRRTGLPRVLPRPLGFRSSRSERRLAAGIVLIGAVLEWLRLPAVTKDTLWAEDVRNFLANAVTSGPIPSLTFPYSGYLHTVPRIIAGLTVQFMPVSLWAYSTAALSCLVAATVAATVFVCSRGILGWLPARLLLAAITLLLPLAPREVLGNTANLHWYFLWLAPWILLYLPRTRRSTVVLSVIAFLATMTEIQMVFFAPLVLFRLRDRRRWPVRAAYLLGVAIQLVVTLMHPRGHPANPFIGIPSLVYGYFINAAMSVWYPGSAAIGHALSSWGMIAVIVAVLPFALAVAVVARLGSRAERRMMALLACASVGLWMIAVEADPDGRYQYATLSGTALDNLWLSRYGVVPSMMLLAIVALALCAAHRRLLRVAPPGSRWQAPLRMIPTVIAVLTVVVMLTQFVPVTTLRSNGPDWQRQVAAAQKSCEHDSPRSSFALSGAPSANWALPLSCTQLERNHS